LPLRHRWHPGERRIAAAVDLGGRIAGGSDARIAVFASFLVRTFGPVTRPIKFKGMMAFSAVAPPCMNITA